MHVSQATFFWLLGKCSRRLHHDFCRQPSLSTVTRRLTGRNHEDPLHAIAMTFDLVDEVWLAMRDDEFYSPADLANGSGQPIHAIVRVLEFLTRYGFTERMVKRDPIFRKLPASPPPGDAIRVLQMLIEDSRVGGREKSRMSPVRGGTTAL